ncbi:hypothetical protein JXJ21_11260 [candidate division KSB1 bacterium]|nr:hypothetical protein [candidate division KSB1 bacterium]
MNTENKQDFLKQVFFKEVEVIQDIIRRMAHNSFMVKGWTITLVAVTLLLKGSKFQVFVAFLPLIVFWFLDAYFLWQERLYRKLYNWVIENRLTSDEFLLDMNAYRFKDSVQSKLRIMFSITLGWFYGSIAILTGAYAAFLLTIN